MARDHPLGREWALIVSAPGLLACLAGWERPASLAPPDGERRFEVVWSFEPQMVHAAIEVASELIEAVAPAATLELPAECLEPPPPGPAELRSASSLAHRMVSYLAR